MPFSLDDQKHLSAAQGYLELGMLADSEAELGGIAPHLRERLEVLAIRLGILHETKHWPALQAVAEKLVGLDPSEPQWAISWAYATRRAASLDSARSILIQALERHPSEALIHFNLACYECQLGDIPSAKQFIQTALQLSPSMSRMALEDEDLAPIRVYLESTIESAG